jgi:hypothetical protein
MLYGKKDHRPKPVVFVGQLPAMLELHSRHLSGVYFLLFFASLIKFVMRAIVQQFL